ncbi:MAG TPA: hypothetical protein DF774_02280 [Rheinheimera sp.]|nr:hypothetical protein [Rheinheimera sp.]
MVVAVIVLSLALLVLIALLLACVLKIVDLNSSLTCTVEHLRSVEESRCRIQALVYQKFNYHVPASDKYLSLEELKLEKASKQGGAA